MLVTQPEQDGKEGSEEARSTPAPSEGSKEAAVAIVLLAVLK